MAARREDVPPAEWTIPSGLARLREVRRSQTGGGRERCELCGAGLKDRHDHLLERKPRRIVCACAACAILFSANAEGRYRRIPCDVRLLRGFALSEEQWEGLRIPIGLAFFCREGDPGRAVAYYPSPAGAVESLLALEQWQEIERSNTGLQRLEPEVEALLVNRVQPPHRYFRAPLDDCYRLVGLIRREWRGISGGQTVWKAVEAYFHSLEERALAGANEV